MESRAGIIRATSQLEKMGQARSRGGCGWLKNNSLRFAYILIHMLSAACGGVRAGGGLLWGVVESVPFLQQLYSDSIFGAQRAPLAGFGVRKHTRNISFSSPFFPFFSHLPFSLTKPLSQLLLCETRNKECKGREGNSVSTRHQHCSIYSDPHSHCHGFTCFPPML